MVQRWWLAGQRQRWLAGQQQAGTQRWYSDGGWLASSTLGRNDGATMVAGWPAADWDATMVQRWWLAGQRQWWLAGQQQAGTQRWCNDGGWPASNRLGRNDGATMVAGLPPM